jgi:hypothetical protein
MDPPTYTTKKMNANQTKKSEADSANTPAFHSLFLTTPWPMLPLRWLSVFCENYPPMPWVCRNDSLLITFRTPCDPSSSSISRSILSQEETIDRISQRSPPLVHQNSPSSSVFAQILHPPVPGRLERLYRLTGDRLRLALRGGSTRRDATPRRTPSHPCPKSLHVAAAGRCKSCGSSPDPGAPGACRGATQPDSSRCPSSRAQRPC